MKPWKLPELKTEVGLAELTAFLSIVATGISALYNFGYFSRLSWSYISLLSVQDFLTGALAVFVLLIAIVPMFGLMAQAPGRPIRTVYLLLTVIFAVNAAGYFILDRDSYFAPAVFLTLAVGTLMLLLTTWARLATFGWMLFAALSAIGPIAIGFANAEGQTRVLMRASTVQLRDGTTLTARVLRTTSSYIFLYDGTQSLLVPMSDVKIITTSLN